VVLLREILASSTRWRNIDDVSRPVRGEDILVIAPYNAQVFELEKRVSGARVGNRRQVPGAGGANRDLLDDKLQPSRCAARMEFLYSVNRLSRHFPGEMSLCASGERDRFRG
jgi:hypothetical protein